MAKKKSVRRAAKKSPKGFFKEYKSQLTLLVLVLAVVGAVYFVFKENPTGKNVAGKAYFGADGQPSVLNSKPETFVAALFETVAGKQPRDEAHFQSWVSKLSTDTDTVRKNVYDEFRAKEAPACLLYETIKGRITSSQRLSGFSPTSTDKFLIVNEFAKALEDTIPRNLVSTSDISTASTNNPPVITSTPIVTSTLGIVYTYAVSASDPDGDDLTYSLRQNPSGMTISRSTGVIEWTPLDADATGQHKIIIDVSDSSLTGSQEYTLTVSIGLTQCSDGEDNDSDGFIDMKDPGCTGPTDTSEYGSVECDDGKDNDGDGLADMKDPGCTGPTDTSEYNPTACSDGEDNDADGFIDMNDPGCSNSKKLNVEKAVGCIPHPTKKGVYSESPAGTVAEKLTECIDFTNKYGSSWSDGSHKIVFNEVSCNGDYVGLMQYLCAQGSTCSIESGCPQNATSTT